MFYLLKRSERLHPFEASKWPMYTSQELPIDCCEHTHSGTLPPTASTFPNPANRLSEERFERFDLSRRPGLPRHQYATRRFSTSHLVTIPIEEIL